MRYRMEAKDTEIQIFMDGRLTFSDHEVLKELIHKIQEAHTATLCILDIENIEFVDSAGLGMLLIIKDELKKNSKSVILRKPVGQVERMLKVSNFSKLFDIYW